MGSVTTPFSKDDIMDEIVPIRSVAKTAKILKELKLSEKEMVPYYSNRYGFTKSLVILLPKDTPEEVVRAKFEIRFNRVPLNNFNSKRDTKV